MMDIRVLTSSAMVVEKLLSKDNHLGPILNGSKL